MDTTLVRRTELAMLALLGAANVVSELVGAGKAAVVAVGTAAWLAWVVVRLKREPGLLRRLGFRADNLGPAAVAVLAVTVPSAAVIAAVALALGNFPPPETILAVLAVYPVWGIVQQLLLDAVLDRHLRALLPDPVALLAAAALFAASHAPDLPLVGLTFVAGLAWVWIYRRRPNLWALGVGHGVLGTLVYYGILGRDPLAFLLH